MLIFCTDIIVFSSQRLNLIPLCYVDGCSSGFRLMTLLSICLYIRAPERSHRAASLWVRPISVAFGRSVCPSVRPSTWLIGLLSWRWGVLGCCVIAVVSYANSGGATPGRARSNDLTGRSIPSPWLRLAYCFASVIVWNKNVTISDRFFFWQWNNQRRWRHVFWGRRLKRS